MYPHGQLLVKTYKDRPFTMLGVNSDKDRAKIRKVMEDKGLDWRAFWDGGSVNGPIATKWNVVSWPTLYVIDHKGVIRFKNVRDEELDAVIEELVKSAEEER